MDDVKDGNSTENAWEQAGTGFAELGDLLRSGFADSEGGDGSSREELRQAWSGFVSAAQGLGQALATTVNDPEIRATVGKAVGPLVDAIGTTVRDTTVRAKRGTDDEEAQDDVPSA